MASWDEEARTKGIALALPRGDEGASATPQMS